LGCTVRELLNRIDSRELSEWMLYEQMEPFGDTLTDMHASQLAYLLAETNRDTKKRKDPFKPDDFSLRFREPKTQQQDARSSLLKLASALGAKVVRSGDHR